MPSLRESIQEGSSFFGEVLLGLSVPVICRGVVLLAPWFEFPSSLLLPLGAGEGRPHGMVGGSTAGTGMGWAGSGGNNRHELDNEPGKLASQLVGYVAHRPHPRRWELKFIVRD
jgi:hypothetical protein